ncbi:MAG: hypothetical protein JWQ77_4243, partial [Jatrophihabitans sp.]|nr:hypothetical protein [Jatrophihabitans sp.]
ADEGDDLLQLHRIFLAESDMLPKAR